MLVAFNTRLAANVRQEAEYFTRKIFPLIAKDHPEHRFLFISDRGNIEAPLPNALTITVKPKPGNILFSRYWFGIKIPAVLKKYKADIFISPEINCSISTVSAQCIITLQPEEARQKGKFYHKAGLIVTGSEFSRQIISQTHGISKEKIKLVRPAPPDIFQPRGLRQKNGVKDKYSEGKEYFLFTGTLKSEKEFIILLKAFSRFKKRQQSSMKLLLLGEKQPRSFLKSLSNYKYREDVKHVDGDEKERAGLISSSYAVICFYQAGDFPFTVLEALHCGVPVISIPHPVIAEIAGDAVLFTEAGNAVDTGDKMIYLYTDENKRSQLIEKGKKIIQQDSLQETADQLWRYILSASGADITQPLSR